MSVEEFDATIKAEVEAIKADHPRQVRYAMYQKMRSQGHSHRRAMIMSECTSVPEVIWKSILLFPSEMKEIYHKTPDVPKDSVSCYYGIGVYGFLFGFLYLICCRIKIFWTAWSLGALGISIGVSMPQEGLEDGEMLKWFFFVFFLYLLIMRVKWDAIMAAHRAKKGL